MEQRSPEDVGRILRSREPVYYGGEESDPDEDFIEDQEFSSIHQRCSCEESSESDEGEEEEEESEEKPQQTTKRKFVYGKDKYKWCLEAPEVRDFRPSLLQPGAKGSSLNANNPYESWNALITDPMLKLILNSTNAEIARSPTEPDEDTNTSFGILTMNELKAFIALLYLMGVKNNKNIDLREMWSTEFGDNLYKAAMSQSRFEFIGARLRFDDKNSRAEKRADDAFAPIRKFWDMFITNCTGNYTPSENLTIDKQLLDFRGKFPARVCVKSKPARCGIAVLSLNDSRTFYMYNAVPYTGRVCKQKGESVSDYYVRSLCETIYGTRRIITCDDWFSSIEIFKKMHDVYELHMIGTLGRCKRQIPACFKRDATAGTMRVGYDGLLSLTSHCPKRNKVALVLSSVHKIVKMDEVISKPETMIYYEQNKRGVEVFDRMCSNYSCARETRRWTLRFFFGILDQAGVNSSILWNLIANHEALTRREFLKKLGLWLIKPHLQDKLRHPSMSASLGSSIREIFGENENGAEPDNGKIVIKNEILGENENQFEPDCDKAAKRKRCAFCERRKDRKTSNRCCKCSKPVCDEHKYSFCHDCAM